MSRCVAITSAKAPFVQDISIGPHQLEADEPVASGGGDTGPDPYELLLAALGACTGMTLRTYSARKGWPLKTVRIHLTHEKVYAEDCDEDKCKEGGLDLIRREILLIGELSHEQRQRLLEIADRCPVHRTLTAQIRIDTWTSPVNASEGEDEEVYLSSVECESGSQ